MNTDQIAAEAADQFPDADIVSPRTRNIRIAIIKSAIEKVELDTIAQCRADTDDTICDLQDKSRAAHASYPHAGEIAAEAADKCYERMMTGGYPVILKEDMTAIIEKGVISALKKYEGKCPICGAPHASDLYRISPINAKYLMQKYPNIIKPAHASEPPQSRDRQGAERMDLELRLQAAAELLTEAKQRLGDTAFPSLSSRIAKFVEALSQRPTPGIEAQNVEPREPREWWAEVPIDGSIGQLFQQPYQKTKGNAELVRVREVIKE